MIGRVLGNRYKLVELIGEGGMALVYKAECSLLRRTVAVKILRPQYANDVDFVERFRREALAAASLSHPNVVGVYDVGNDEGLDYIVMEYLSGTNLKVLIKKGAPFPVKRALEIIRQIAEALQHAHQHNIVHRDIKPHNILMTSDGRVKVTDFGIARAISATSTTHEGMVVGSVQYASPEQIRGKEVGPQSDIYSLGCVLYELLSGTIPFKGETSMAIAMQHLEEYAAPIRSIRPETPLAVENLLKKTLAKDLNVRYASASAMLRDLNKVLSAPEIQKTDETETVDGSTQVWKPIVAGEGLPEKAKWWVFPVVFGSSFLLVVLLGMLFFGLLSPPRGEVTVPNLVGMELEDAKDILKENHLKLKITKQIFNSKYAMNRVISQKPLSGQIKRAGSVIEIVLSKGPELVRVPELFGKTRQEAELILDEIGLKLGEILTGTDDTQPRDVVIKQLPEADTQIERGAIVSITVNSPPGLVQVPNFIGRQLADVQADLNSLGLSFNKATSIPNSIHPAGAIVDQRPAPGERVPKGTALTFIISSGPPST